VQQINDKQRVCEEVRISLESLQRELNVIHNNKSKLENDISRLEKEKSYSVEMAQEYEAKRVNAEIRLNHIQESIANAGRDLDMMQRRLNEQSKREEQGKNKCKELLGQQDRLTNELHRLNESKTGEETCILQRKEDLALLEVSRERIKKEILECQQDKQGLVLDLEKLRLQSESASKGYEYVTNEIQERQSTLEILQGQVSDAKLSLDAMRKDCLLKEGDYYLISKQCADEEAKLAVYVGRMQEIQQLLHTAEQGYQDFQQECFSQRKDAIAEIDTLTAWPRENKEVQRIQGAGNDNRTAEIRLHPSPISTDNSDIGHRKPFLATTATTATTVTNASLSLPAIASDLAEDTWVASTKGMTNLRMVVDRLRTQSRGVLQELDAQKSN
jgi:chromosome segregation ATPase